MSESDIYNSDFKRAGLIEAIKNMKIVYLKLKPSLLPAGEGQDEGINKNNALSYSAPLTPTLFLRERELMG